MNYNEEYPLLLHHMVTVSGSMGGQPVGDEPSMVHIEGISMKLIFHASAAYSLYRGTTLRYDEKTFLQFTDFSSIAVLTRSALETFLAFHFVYCDPATADERRFRFLCWHYGGYLDRQELPVISDEGAKLLQNEAAQMEDVKKEILAHPIFNTLSKKQQDKILDGQWRMGFSWPALAEKAGFNKEYFTGIYSHLCGYAHTSRLSINQVQQAKDRAIQQDSAEACLSYCLITMANFLFSFASLFPVADRAFKEDQSAYDLALEWREVGRNIHKGNDGG